MTLAIPARIRGERHLDMCHPAPLTPICRPPLLGRCSSFSLGWLVNTQYRLSRVGMSQDMSHFCISHHTPRGRQGVPHCNCSERSTGQESSSSLPRICILSRPSRGKGQRKKWIKTNAISKVRQSTSTGMAMETRPAAHRDQEGQSQVTKSLAFLS